MTRTSFGILLLAGGLMACASLDQPSDFDSPATTDTPRKNVVVQFSDASLEPSIARVLEGGNVAWVNMADGFVGAVVFPPSVEGHFTCSELRPLFTKVAAGYQSIPITARGGEQVTLPCPLKPGRYEYKIYLTSGGDDTVVDLEDPVQILPAVIVVE